MSDLVKIRDEMDQVQHLVEVAFMACADVSQDQGGPLRTLLDLVSEKMKEISTKIDMLRGAKKAGS